MSSGQSCPYDRGIAMSFIEWLAALIFIVMTVGFLGWVAWLAISK